MHIERSRVTKQWLALTCLTLITVLIWCEALAPRSTALNVTLLDVGQGDSIFIQTPSGQTMLVDGGGRNDSGEDTVGSRVVEPFLRRQGVNSLDVVVLTHPHADHVQGLSVVARDFHVGLLLDTATAHPSDAYRDFLRIVKKRRIRYHVAVRGQAIDFGDGVRAEVLNPPAERLSGTEDDVNNNSVVLKLTYAGSALLLSGDAGEEAEQSMLSSGADVRAGVIKLAHHGSQDATGERWLDAVGPRFAVISVGRDNSFGHPSRDVLDMLSSRGIKTYRTDKSGAVNLRFTPKTSCPLISVQTASD